MRKKRGRSGAVSIQTLWLLLIISFLAVGLAMRSSLSISLTRRSLDSTRSEFMVRSLAKMVCDQITAADSLDCEYGGKCVTLPGQLDIDVDGDTYYLEVLPGAWPDDTILSGTWDEESRINLNTAPRFVLENLFSDPMRVEEIVRYRRDFRQFKSDSARRVDSLPDPTEQQAPFGTVDELLRLESITVEDLKLRRSYLTAFGDGRININTAAAGVLAAIGCPRSLVKKLFDIREGDGGSTEDQSGYILLDWELLPAELIRRNLGISTEEQNWIKLAKNRNLIGSRSRHFSFCVSCKRTATMPERVVALTIKRSEDGQSKTAQASTW